MRLNSHSALHTCILALDAGILDLDAPIFVKTADGVHTETTVEALIVDELTEHTCAYSQAQEDEWREAWEAEGEDSGYQEYKATDPLKFKWQEVNALSKHLGTSYEVLMKFLRYIDTVGFSDWSVEWDENNNVLIVNPD